jgi:HD-GYP domain-containing protein (c-di-GMP phosphodiesterase class II)
MVGLDPLVLLIGAAEDLLGYIREGRIPYVPDVSDVMLLILEQVSRFITLFAEEGKVDYDHELFDSVQRSLSSIGDSASEGELVIALESIVGLLDPVVTIPEPTASAGQKQASIKDIHASADIEREINYFRDLMMTVENHSVFWSGRSDRILRMSNILNRAMDCPVDEQQLSAAVYVHDLGMAVMPVDIAHKQTTDDSDNFMIMQRHVEYSAHFLELMPAWAEAHEIVCQHHEASDGSGYPNGLVEENIHTGAKILAIADTFEAYTHDRASHSHQKRPILRSIAEINNLSGTRLSPYWVDVFNKTVAALVSTQYRANS